MEENVAIFTKCNYRNGSGFIQSFVSKLWEDNNSVIYLGVCSLPITPSQRGVNCCSYSSSILLNTSIGLFSSGKKITKFEKNNILSTNVVYIHEIKKNNVLCH